MTTDLDKISEGVTQGTLTMLCQTPLVTALNRISVVGCSENVTFSRAALSIYRGMIDKKAPSMRHFFRGVEGHLMKECSRISFKAGGIVMKPKIDQSFDAAWKSDFVFASTLSCCEMLINPADTLRVMWQAGERYADIPKKTVLRHLYKGALANGFRQFGTWTLFPKSERRWSQAVESYIGLDPYSSVGVIAKSLPQTFQITTPVWMFERLKNELQYHPEFQQQTFKHYLFAFRYIEKRYGMRGFVRGYMAKVLSNYILVIGANFLLNKGRNFQD